MKYFSEREFTCKCGRCDQGVGRMSPNLLKKLDAAREFAGVPFKLTSAFRCADHNAFMGGKPGSAHTKGYAVDIACDGSRTRHAVLTGLIRAGFTRIGIANNFIHADVDPAKAPNVIWTY